jgi:hypothetical protein
MHVIGHAIDDPDGAAALNKFRSHFIVDITLNLRFYQRHAIPGAPDCMNPYFGKGMGHKES